MECTVPPAPASSSSTKRIGNPAHDRSEFEAWATESGRARHYSHGAELYRRLQSLAPIGWSRFSSETYAGPDAVYQALTGICPVSDPAFVDSITLLNDYMQKGVDRWRSR